LTELMREIADLDRALELLADKISFESRKASELVVDAVEDDYRTAVSDICMALVALHEAHVAFANIVDSLNEDAVFWTGRLWPMHPTFLQDPKEKYSPIGSYLREASTHGFVEFKLVPPELRV